MRTTLPSPVSATAIRTIHGRAEGNPFYTIQLARLLGAERRPEDEVPPTVRDAVRCRLAQLLPETTDLLAVAAIIGRDFDLGLLAATQVLTLDECAQVLEPSLEERILVDHSGGVTPW